MKIRPVGAEFQVDGRTYGRTDAQTDRHDEAEKVAFRNFACERT
jgi:hypothetical protein